MDVKETIEEKITCRVCGMGILVKTGLELDFVEYLLKQHMASEHPAEWKKFQAYINDTKYKLTRLLNKEGMKMLPTDL